MSHSTCAKGNTKYSWRACAPLRHFRVSLQLDDDTTTTAGGPAEEQGAVQLPSKRFKFAARHQQDRERERRITSTSAFTLSNWTLYLKNALEYWQLKESQYPSISKLAQNLVSAPSSQAYVEGVFFWCAVISLLESVIVPVLVWKETKQEGTG